MFRIEIQVNGFNKELLEKLLDIFVELLQSVGFKVPAFAIINQSEEKEN